MALIVCKECGKEISDKALTCPHCGSPNGEVEVESAQKEKKSINKKTMIIGIVALAIVLVIVGIFVYNKNKKSPMQKIIYDDYQVLKEEFGDNIELVDALYFKRTKTSGDEAGQEWYEVLLVYKSHGKIQYAGFNDDGEYLGNGDEYVSSTNPDMDTAWNNFTVSMLIIEYEQYAEGEKKVLYTTKDYEDVVDEKDAGDYEHCLVPVSLDKIK